MSFGVFRLKHLLGQIYPSAIRTIFYRNVLMYYDVTMSLCLFGFSVLPHTLSLSIERWVGKSRTAGKKERGERQNAEGWEQG